LNYTRGYHSLLMKEVVVSRWIAFYHQCLVNTVLIGTAFEHTRPLPAKATR